MFKLRRQQLLLMLCLALFLVLVLHRGVLAELPVVKVQIPAEWGVNPQKVLFSADGSKFALLLEEAAEGTIRGQAIVIYDFSSKEWVKAASISEGVSWILEPLAFSQDGSKLAIRLKEDLIVYDVKANQMTHNLQDVGSETEVAFSPNGMMLSFLTNAEWEVPTSLAVMDLLTKDSQKALGLCVAYNGDNKAAGPLIWGAQGEIYYIEEFTWGSINSRGILKQYIPGQGNSVEVYNSKNSTTRVAGYSFSPDWQHIALIMRDLQEDFKTSRYALLIRTEESFVYGQMLTGWIDQLDAGPSSWLSTSGWISKDRFYWVNRSEKGSDLFIYDLGQQKLHEFHSAEQVYVSPTGVILQLER